MTHRIMQTIALFPLLDSLAYATVMDEPEVKQLQQNSKRYQFSAGHLGQSLGSSDVIHVGSGDES